MHLMPELGLDGKITVCLNELGEEDFPRQGDLSLQNPWDRECDTWKEMQMIQHKPVQRVKEHAWGLGKWGQERRLEGLAGANSWRVLHAVERGYILPCRK